jgi:class 3 adenylate cyclase
VVNRAEGLMAAAHGGRVICSLAVAELARTAVPADITFSDLGAHRLKDLLEPEMIEEVHGPAFSWAFRRSARWTLPVTTYPCSRRG